MARRAHTVNFIDMPLLSSKDTMNCAEKVIKISHFNQNQSAHSIYIKIELCYFSLDQWEIRIHLLWGKCFNIPHHCDPRLNQTKFNDLLPLTIDGVLMKKRWFGEAHVNHLLAKHDFLSQEKWSLFASVYICRAELPRRMIWSWW